MYLKYGVIFWQGTAMHLNWKAGGVLIVGKAQTAPCANMTCYTYP